MGSRCYLVLMKRAHFYPIVKRVWRAINFPGDPKCRMPVMMGIPTEVVLRDTFASAEPLVGATIERIISPAASRK